MIASFYSLTLHVACFRGYILIHVDRRARPTYETVNPSNTVQTVPAPKNKQVQLDLNWANKVHVKLGTHGAERSGRPANIYQAGKLQSPTDPLLKLGHNAAGRAVESPFGAGTVSLLY